MNDKEALLEMFEEAGIRYEDYVTSLCIQQGGFKVEFTFTEGDDMLEGIEVWQNDAGELY